MSEVETKPPTNDLYEIDFYAWTQEQARLLRERRWSELDLENLIDEVASVGGTEKREIRNRMIVLVSHLLKWKYQPGHRGPSWRRTMREQRRQLADIVKTSPGLAEYVKQQVAERYLGATSGCRERDRHRNRSFSRGVPIHRGTGARSRFLSRRPVDRITEIADEIGT